jgi:hypothetical protein
MSVLGVTRHDSVITTTPPSSTQGVIRRNPQHTPVLSQVMTLGLRNLNNILYIALTYNWNTPEMVDVTDEAVNEDITESISSVESADDWEIF